MRSFLQRFLAGLTICAAFIAACSRTIAAPDEKTADQPAANSTGDTEKTETLTIGSPAPPIEVEHWLSNGNGKFQAVTEFASGKIYIVEFWATWCGPCIASMPHLAEIQTKYADRDVQIVSVSDEDLETVEKFLKRPVRGAKKEEEKASDNAASVEDKGGEQKPQPGTYGELTSVYCLTADPDRSVHTAYMKAAGRNGIPCCFIVGKTGVVEWIGHPMAMDASLQQIVEGEWDREAFLVQYRKEQERSLLTAKLSALIRRNDFEGALALLAEAKAAAAGDAASIAAFEDLEFRVKTSGALRKLQGDQFDEGLTELQEIMQTANPVQKSQLAGLKLNALMSKQMFEDAAQALHELANVEGVSPMAINQITWRIYETAKTDSDFSAPLLDAAVSATEKAVAGDPDNGMIMDTLAHLLHLQGNLDGALQWQQKALENPGEATAEALDEMRAFLKQLKTEKEEN